MSIRIFAVANLNIPGPTADTLADRVRTLTAGNRPITTKRVAELLNCSVEIAEYGLNLALRMGLVRRVAQGWIAT